MTKSDRPQEPERLDAHRAARDPQAAEPTADHGDEPAPPPASFEEAPAVQRARHLEQLRELVDSGDYRPEPGKIAESMLDNERS